LINAPAASRTAAAYGLDTVAPSSGLRRDTAIRRVPGPASGAAASPASDGVPVPDRTASISRVSSTVVASGPFSDRPNQSPSPMPAGTTPRPGLMVTRPQFAAGIRSDPMPSLPSARGTIPAATAAALPPEEPPALRA